MLSFSIVSNVGLLCSYLVFYLNLLVDIALFKVSLCTYFKVLFVTFLCAVTYFE